MEVRWRDPPYLPTINSLEMANVVEETAKSVLGEDRFQRIGAPTMAGEDFSYMASELQSCSSALCFFTMLQQHSSTFIIVKEIAKSIPQSMLVRLVNHSMAGKDSGGWLEGHMAQSALILQYS